VTRTHRTLFLAACSAVLLLVAAPPAWADTYKFTTINVPGESQTNARGINDKGQIVGTYFDGSNYYGFLDSGGKFTTIDVPVPGVTDTVPVGINEAGQIVGWYFGPYVGIHGFLETAGSFTTIDDPSGCCAEAFGINDAGQISGTFTAGAYHGFLDTSGSFTTIDAPGEGAWGTDLQGLNNSGQLTGFFWDGAHWQSFLDSSGVFTAFAVPGATDTLAYGVNDGGSVVGYYYTSPIDIQQGFLDEGGMFSTISVPGSYFTFAEGINDRGQIVGDSALGGFLATPTPEPGTLLLLGTGALGLLAHRNTRRARH
jgi:uncharacterized membrane protein